MTQPFRTQDASDVQVDQIVQATQYRTLRTDALNARGGLDFAELEDVLDASPAVGDVAVARDNGSVYVCYQAGTWTLHIEGPGQAPGENYWDGLQLVRINSDDIEIGVGVARNIQDTFTIEVMAPLTKKLDEVFAAGADNGMRDSSASLGAAKWFNLYLLSQASGITMTDLFATPKATTESLTDSLPTGWDRHSFVGAIYWNGGGIDDFYHRGKEFRWKIPVTTVDNSTGVAGVFETATLRVPSLQNGTLAKIVVSLAGGDGAIVRRVGQADSGVSHSICVGSRNAYVEVLTDEDAVIEYTMLGTWGTIKITTVGWEDERGFGAKQPPSTTLQLIDADSGDLAGGAFNSLPVGVWPDDTGVLSIDDNGSSGGEPQSWAMNPTTKIVTADTQLNGSGNANQCRGPSLAGLWFRPDGVYAALYGRDRTTQAWHLVILNTINKTTIDQAGAYLITSDPTVQPPTAQVQAIWDDDRERLYVPTNTGPGDILIYDVSTPASPTHVADHTIAGAAARNVTSMMWSENKTCIYAVGAGVFGVFEPAGDGDSFTEDLVNTFATTTAFTALAHDGSTIVVMRGFGSQSADFQIYDINPADETDVTLNSVHTLDLNGLITGSQIGVAGYATMRNDIFGCWFRNFGSTSPAQYVTFDMSDLSDPMFLAELLHLVDPDASAIGSSQHWLFDGLHTQVLAGDVDDEPTQSKGLSIVGYL